MQYGLPYMGSKSNICEEIVKIFPSADNFYDLFGGGFSVTHAMLVHRLTGYKEFHFNELRPGVCDLIKDAIVGKYSYKNYLPKWVSREEFHAKKDIDILIKIIWSFGNNGRSYLFGEDIEDQKKSLHNAVIFNEFDSYAQSALGMKEFKKGTSVNQRRLFVRNRLNEYQLQQLERLQRLQQLERLQQISFYSGSYLDVPIKKNSVIYCDIPYHGTAEYDGNSSFDRLQFLDWAANNSEPVFISEYEVNDPRFKCIASFKKRSLLKPDKSNTLIKYEKIFVNQAASNKISVGNQIILV